MSIEAPTSDADLLDLLRSEGSLAVDELAQAIEVTPTAVRQRLMRLMGQQLIDREAIRIGRGRPKHLYRLTDKGLRLTGSNFTDLALALWRQIGAIDDVKVREDMIERIAKALAEQYADQVQGATAAERMRSLGTLLAQRRIPVSVEDLGRGTVMTQHACPYPKLAEQDPDVCRMEKLLISQLVGQNVELTRCRLEGAADCQFQAEPPNGESTAPAMPRDARAPGGNGPGNCSKAVV
jgi:DeoR family transcriptional regulator, suf operon transcriptional repressor